MTWQALHVAGGIRRMRRVVQILTGCGERLERYGEGWRTIPAEPAIAEAVYLPAIVWSDTETRALLDGYLFAVLDPREIAGDERLSDVRPIGMVSEAEIATLRAVELHGVGAARPWEAGELLEITRGPFAGLVGAFDSRAKRWGILVRIECLGRELLVEVDERIAARLSQAACRSRKKATNKH